MKKKIILIVVTFGIILGFFFVRDFEVIEPLDSFQTYLNHPNQIEKRYTEYLSDMEGVHSIAFHPIHILATSMNRSENALLLLPSESFGQQDGAIQMNRDHWIEFEIMTENWSVVQIELEYLYIGEELFPPKFSVLVDQSYPFYESRQTSVPLDWKVGLPRIPSDYQQFISFQQDRYLADIQPKSEITREWNSAFLHDASYYHLSPLKYTLQPGAHIIRLIANSDNILVHSVRLVGSEVINTYQEYTEYHQNQPKYDQLITLEAEHYYTKSDPSIKLYSDRRPGSTPFSTSIKRLNAIDAYTWDEAGRSITWEFFVPQTGMYQLALKYLQYRLTNISSFREVRINYEIPFKELSLQAFPYTTEWKNITLGDKEGAFWIYLEEGQNFLTLTSTFEPYLPIVETVESILSGITNLSIEVQKLTGGNADAMRDWDLTDYIPDLEERLNAWISILEDAYRYAHSINHLTSPAAELVNLKLAYNQLKILAKDANRLPNQMNLLSEGTTSASKYLGDFILRITRQSLGVEKIYLVGDSVSIPKPHASIWKSLTTSISLFIQSFRPQAKLDSNPEQTIDVWVNRPRANIDLMQQFIDETFTPESGISVNLSLMPNPSKLILANAANIEPDLAMGVSSQTPFNFAIRNAVVDLRQFEAFESIVENFFPGAMIPYVYDEGVYGFPETQDFFVQFYRTDILSQMNQPIPQTWQEVIGILPVLRRMGMNYYHPLGSSNSYKSFVVTMPFYEQFGASIYQNNGLRSAIDSEEAIAAMSLMSQLFTVHDLPKGTANFYNHFRYGNLPIGIGNSQTYLQLLIAAPEIKGNWDIGLYPGLQQDDGIHRYASAPTTATMIFSSSQKQDLAIEFLSWWHSTEVQTRFTNDIQKVFGKEYMWFSANRHAFANMSIDSRHKVLILEQLEWIVEAPNTPGGYYIEREISNAWNKIVMNDENIRSSIDDATIAANRELWRKLNEFGFVNNTTIIRNYPIPTRENIGDWLTRRSDDDA